MTQRDDQKRMTAEMRRCCLYVAVGTLLLAVLLSVAERIAACSCPAEPAECAVHGEAATGGYLQ